MIPVAVVTGYMVRIGCTNTIEDALYYIKKIRPLANPASELVELLQRMNE